MSIAAKLEAVLRDVQSGRMSELGAVEYSAGLAVESADDATRVRIAVMAIKAILRIRTTVVDTLISDAISEIAAR